MYQLGIGGINKIKKNKINKLHPKLFANTRANLSVSPCKPPQLPEGCKNTARATDWLAENPKPGRPSYFIYFIYFYLFYLFLQFLADT